MTTKRRFHPICASLFVSLCLSAWQVPGQAEVLPPSHEQTTTTDASAPADIAPAPTAKPTALGRLTDFTNHASQLAVQAIGMLGIHYKYGGNTPESGLDCSGLVRYVFKETLGTELPRTAVEISRVGKTIDLKDMRPGDLVFFNTLKRGFSHVGIYLGENRFIHSPSAGGEVRIESMDINYWKKRFNGARRIADSDSGNNGQ